MIVMAPATGPAEVLEELDPLMDGFSLMAVIALAPIISVMKAGHLFNRKQQGGVEQNVQ